MSEMDITIRFPCGNLFQFAWPQILAFLPQRRVLIGASDVAESPMDLATQ